MTYEIRVIGGNNWGYASDGMTILAIPTSWGLVPASRDRKYYPAVSVCKTQILETYGASRKASVTLAFLLPSATLFDLYFYNRTSGTWLTVITDIPIPEYEVSCFHPLDDCVSTLSPSRLNADTMKFRVIGKNGAQTQTTPFTEIDVQFDMCSWRPNVYRNSETDATWAQRICDAMLCTSPGATPPVSPRFFLENRT